VTRCLGWKSEKPFLLLATIAYICFRILRFYTCKGVSGAFSSLKKDAAVKASKTL